MRPRIVRTIAVKELVESLRDRRTLFMMVVVPVLLYPALILVVTQVATVQQGKLEAQRSRVGVVGASEAPTLFEALESAAMLDLELVSGGESAVTGGEGYDVVVTLARAEGSLETHPTRTVTLSYDSVDERSRLGVSRVREQLETWSEAEVERRLAAARLSGSLARPVAIEVEDQADQAARGGWMLGSVLPLLIVMTVLLGAYYPAIDLTAGEKERGSIQTLFTAPIATLEVVAGKYLAVTLIAVISGVVNLFSMALVLGYTARSLPGDMDASLSLSAAVSTTLIVLLTAGLLAAVSMTVAVLARDFKDGQNLMTPVIMLCVLPGVVVQLPGFELTWGWALVPVVNAMLLMKQVLVRGADAQSIFLVAASTLTYTSALLVLASRLFGQEGVVIGERGRFSWSMVRPAAGAPSTPGAGQALALFAVLFVAVFYVGGWTQSQAPIWGLVLTLWGLLLVPTLVATRWGGFSLRETLSWRRPTGLHLASAVLLGGSLWVVVGAADAWIVQELLPVPEALKEAMESFFPRPTSVLEWAALLGVAALSPAVCEELLFRGFIFSGLRSRLGGVGVVVLSAVLFGAFHMSVHRMFGATTLGLAMGLLVWRSRSIWPSMLFHGLNNGTALVVMHTWPESTTAPTWLVGAAAGVSGLGLLVLWASPQRARGEARSATRGAASSATRRS